MIHATDDSFHVEDENHRRMLTVFRMNNSANLHIIGARQGVSGSGEVTRAELIELHKWLGKYLEETEPQLPTGDYAVIDAVLAYGDNEVEMRLVRVPSLIGDSDRHYWSDQELDNHVLDSDHLKSFTVVSEGI